MCFTNECLQHWELVLKVAALLGAILFFLFKLTNGVYVYSLGVALSCTRRKQSEHQDFLVISAELKAGNVSTVELHDIQARISWDAENGKQSRIVIFTGIERPGADLERHFRVNWNSDRRLRIRQGEAPTFSALAPVPRGTPCFVELSVVGRRAFVGLLPGNWKSTTYVLPEA